MERKMRCFYQGVLSIFSLDRVRLLDSDEIDLEAEFKDIRPFVDDKDAIASDWKNVGSSIQKAIEKYEAKRIAQV